jgi:hypothetical protein
MFPETFVELVTAVKSAKKGDISFWAAVENTDCIGICNEF